MGFGKDACGKLSRLWLVSATRIDIAGWTASVGILKTTKNVGEEQAKFVRVVVELYAINSA